MKIQYVSDLHLEGASIELENPEKAELLILAGDITTAKSYKSHLDFFKKCSDDWETVVHVCGNHEFYRGDIEETREELLEFFYRNFKNIHTLENESISVRAIRVYGASLWTDCNRGDPLTARVLQQGMNDYRLIQWKSREHWKLRPSDTAEIHRESLSLMKAYLDTYRDIPTVVVTHHGPSRMSIHPDYSEDYHMNGGYVSSLEDWLIEEKYNIPLWIHGHVHNTFDYNIGEINVLTNPRGYMIPGRDGKRYPENINFNPDKTITIKEKE